MRVSKALKTAGNCISIPIPNSFFEGKEGPRIPPNSGVRRSWKASGKSGFSCISQSSLPHFQTPGSVTVGCGVRVKHVEQQEREEGVENFSILLFHPLPPVFLHPSFAPFSRLGTWVSASQRVRAELGRQTVEQFQRGSRGCCNILGCKWGNFVVFYSIRVKFSSSCTCRIRTERIQLTGENPASDQRIL